jgi:hypothetical protein
MKRIINEEMLKFKRNRERELNFDSREKED